MSQRLGWQALNDDVVAVKGNHGHCPDWDASEEWTGLDDKFDINLHKKQLPSTHHAVQFTHQRSEHPSLVIAVVDHWWPHCEHDEKVRHSQVDDNKVRWCTEWLCLREDVNHAEIAKECNHREQTDRKAQNWMPEGLNAKKINYFHQKDWRKFKTNVHGRELVPVFINKRQHFLWHFVDDGPVTEDTGSAGTRPLLEVEGLLSEIVCHFYHWICLLE